MNTQWDMVYGEKYQYTYDGQGRVTENVYSDWDSSNQQWQINSRETAFVYNGNLLTQFDSQSWNGSSFDNEERTVLIYSAPSTAPKEAEFKVWNGNNFENDFRYTNLQFQNWCGMFCDETALASGTIQVWGSPVTNQWNTVARTSTTYDVFGGSVQLNENYDNSAWVNGDRYSEFYDNKYNYTGTKGETWDTSNVAWTTDWEEKEIHTYNPSNQIVETVFQYWDWITSQLENNMKKEYFDFQTFTGNREFKDEAKVLLYPNPGKGTFFLEVSSAILLDREHLTLKLYDSQGAEVYTAPVTGSVNKIEAETLPAGLYFYQLNDSGQNFKTGKLLIQ